MKPSTTTRQPHILVVEDNPMSRKLLRVALESEGYRVEEAEDGRAALLQFSKETPDIVLQDIVLPDANGIDIAHKLRDLPGGAEVPIVAVTGLVSRANQVELTAPVFNHMVAKPIELPVLFDTLQQCLPFRPASQHPGQDQLVLVADDDSMLRKLSRLRLLDLGFRVVTVHDGAEALAEARRLQPAAILSDVMMPRVDGFRLCQFVREDPKLRDIPVVLISSHYTGAEDQKLAKLVGANALVERDEGLRKAVQALVSGLSEKSPALSTEDPSSLHEAHLQRVMNQLERQASLVAGKAVHCALQSATLTVIQRVCDIISHETIIDDALKDILYIVADLASASMGALYLRTPEGDLTLAARVNGPSDEALQAFAATPHLARAPDAGDEPFVVEATEPSVASLLGSCSATSGVAVPLVASNQQLGILFLTFRDHGELDADRMSFARMAGAHIGQAVAVRRAFARAAKAEHRYRTIMENATDGIWVLAPDGTLLDANAQTEKIHRSPRTEMLGRHFSELLPKETVPARLGTFDELRRLGVIRADNVKIARGDGKIGLVDVSAFVGGVGDNEVMIALEHDNTERQLLEEQLHQAQKMEAIGQLTAGIAHDFNNILAVVLGNSHFLLEGLAKDDPNRGDAEEIRVAAERAATLTRQLLAFSRRQVLEPTLIDLNATVEGVRTMLRRVIGEDIDLSVTLASDLQTVRADVGQIEQVIMNLVVNARDAMPSGGTLSIQTANVELDEDYVASHLTVPPGKYVVLTVSDTGCGMSDETKKHIFEPFFTTKELGKGSGLGLSTCYGIVKQSSGHIWVYSEVGHGTVFKIYLPVVDAPPAEARKKVPRADLRGTETVLVLEDDFQVRAAVCRILRDRGYRVLAAGDGLEAMRIVTEHAGPIDLVLSDLILPSSTGPEIVRDALGQRTGTKVLFMSGYTDHAALRQLSAGAEVNLIQKPFSPETLARRVRTVLDG